MSSKNVDQNSPEAQDPVVLDILADVNKIKKGIDTLEKDTKNFQKRKNLIFKEDMNTADLLKVEGSINELQERGKLCLSKLLNAVNEDLGENEPDLTPESVKEVGKDGLIHPKKGIMKKIPKNLQPHFRELINLENRVLSFQNKLLGQKTRKVDDEAKEKEEIAKIKEQIQENQEKIEIERKKVVDGVEADWYRDYSEKFQSGLLNLIFAKVDTDPLTDAEAIALRRKQDAYNEIRVQKELYDRGILDLPDGSVKSIASMIGKGAITGQQTASAVAAGASEIASELYWLGIDRALIFLAWPIALPIKILNIFLNIPKAFATAFSVTADELLFKPFVSPAWEWFKKPPGGAGGVAARAFASPFIAAGALFVGVLKATAFVFERAKKYCDYDYLVRKKPNFSMLVGGLGGPAVLIGTLALLIAAPFTFGATGLVLGALWASFGLSVAAGVGLAVKKGKDAAKAEMQLKLSPDETVQLMEYDHRHKERTKEDAAMQAKRETAEAKIAAEKVLESAKEPKEEGGFLQTLKSWFGGTKAEVEKTVAAPVTPSPAIAAKEAAPVREEVGSDRKRAAELPALGEQIVAARESRAVQLPGSDRPFVPKAETDRDASNVGLRKRNKLQVSAIEDEAPASSRPDESLPAEEPSKGGGPGLKKRKTE